MTDYLFGDNISDQVKTIQDTNKVGKKVSTSSSEPQSFLGSKTSWTHGSRKGKGGWGKSRYNPHHNQGQRNSQGYKEHTSETEAVEVSDSVYVPIAGRIKHFYHKWTELTSDVNILKIVRGCKLDFTSSPFQHTVRETKLNKSESDLAKDEIKSLVNKGVLKEVDYDKDQFISTIFFRPKPDGTYRMILNLKV